MKSPGLTPASPGRLKHRRASIMMPPTTAVLRIPIVPSIRTSVSALKRLSPMVRLMAFRCDYFTPHGQLLDPSDVDVNASYFEFAQIYLLRSERHGPMYFDFPLFCTDSPARFRSEAVNALLPH